MCNSNSGRTICLASCNYYNISYPIRQHPFSWKACKTFSLFFVHHAHYLTKTIFIFSAFNQISTLCSPPLSEATHHHAFPEREGEPPKAVEGFPTEIFCFMFQFYTITPLSAATFSLPKSAPTAIPGRKSAPQIFSLISKQIPEW